MKSVFRLIVSFILIVAMSIGLTFGQLLECNATKLEEFENGEAAGQGLDVTEDNITSYYGGDLDESFNSNELVDKNKSLPSYFLSSSSDFYEVQSIEFKDSQNNLVTGITENGAVSKVTLTKISDEPMPATIVAAVYELNGKLRQMGKFSIDGDELTGEDIDVPITVSLGTSTAGLSIKVFVWNSMNGLMPLAGIYQYLDERGMTCGISSVDGQDAYLTIAATGIDSFVGKIFTINYDPSILELTDAVGLTPHSNITVGIAPLTNIEILSIGNGVMEFSVSTAIASGKVWNGDINILKFTGLQTRASTVVITVR